MGSSVGSPSHSDAHAQNRRHFDGHHLGKGRKARKKHKKILKLNRFKSDGSSVGSPCLTVTRMRSGRLVALRQSVSLAHACSDTWAHRSAAPPLNFLMSEGHEAKRLPVFRPGTILQARCALCNRCTLLTNSGHCEAPECCGVSQQRKQDALLFRWRLRTHESKASIEDAVSEKEAEYQALDAD
ncbi:uncharacterized [Tachysurus ichikawai]